MNKKLKMCATLIAAITVVGSVIPTNIAYAAQNSDDYDQTISELKSAIAKKIDKIEIDNKVSENDFEDAIDDAIKNEDEYEFDIVDYEKEKATVNSAGKVTFDIEITDADDNDYTVSIYC